MRFYVKCIITLANYKQKKLLPEKEAKYNKIKCHEIFLSGNHIKEIRDEIGS